MTPRRLSRASIERLPVYLRVVFQIAGNRQRTISSEELARLTGVSQDTIRRDFFNLGLLGIRGVGYEVDHLLREISKALGVAEEQRVVIAGAGNLGQALANYAGFSSRGFRIVGLFDTDPKKIGTSVGTLVVHGLDLLEPLVREEKATLGVISTPPDAAQEVATRMVSAGVISLLNFAPTLVEAPPHVSVRNVDLAIELQILSFYGRNEVEGLEQVALGP